MASADLELQGAIFARLSAYAPLIALVGTRHGYGTKVFDRPPDGVSMPYVDIGEAQSIRSDATCVDGQDIFLTLHAWSDYPGGHKEAKQIADAVVSALHDYAMTLATNRLVSISHRQTRVFSDADGASSHAVIEFVAFTEKS